MAKFKYVVYPGPVTSNNDGDRHFISFGRLCDLYGVKPSRCLNMGVRNPGHGYNLAELEGLPVLRPSMDGDYDLNNIKEKFRAE